MANKYLEKIAAKITFVGNQLPKGAKRVGNILKTDPHILNAENAKRMKNHTYKDKTVSKEEHEDWLAKIKQQAFKK